MIKKYWQKGGKQKIIVIIVGLILLIALFMFRDELSASVVIHQKIHLHYFFKLLLYFILV